MLDIIRSILAWGEFFLVQPRIAVHAVFPGTARHRRRDAASISGAILWTTVRDGRAGVVRGHSADVKQLDNLRSPRLAKH